VRLPFLAVLCTALAPLGAHAADGGILGDPTPALPIYAAQVRHAHDACQAAGLVDDAKAGDAFYANAVERGLQLAYYRKHVPAFGPALDAVGERYRQAWATMDATERQAFCAGYLDDVRWSAATWRLPVIQASDRFRSTFSPPSAQRVERAKAANMLLGVLSLGATAAGVNQTSQHDFAAAHDLNAAGGALAQGMADPSARPPGCAAYAPFVAMNQRLTAADVRSYHSIRSCDAGH
jgi:hypothetical protein